MRRVRAESRQAVSRFGRRLRSAWLEALETRALLTPIVVRNTADDGPGSLRQAILEANARPGADLIVFNIPASTAPLLDVPVPGFDPIMQTWTITPLTPLPAITDTVTIDGYSQAHAPVPYRYPSTVQQVLTLTRGPTGGSFTLSTQAPLPSRTTAPIPFDAGTTEVAEALVAILGAGNVSVSGGPSLPGNSMTIRLTGELAEFAGVPLIGSSSLTGGTDPQVQLVRTALPGDNLLQIVSRVNELPATDGNTAAIRVILDGSQVSGATGLVVSTSHSQVRGLAIGGFHLGISIPSPDNVGNLIQGNAIGGWFLYPVEAATGEPLPAPNQVAFQTHSNTTQGVLLGSTNATIGGAIPQANNIIVANGLQGVSILEGAEGNQVIGNQIGTAGPSINGRFVVVPNGAEGVLVAASSNFVGGAVAGAGNLISGNLSHGVRIVGAGATRNNVEGNFIGIGPGGGFVFGAENTGNRGDGVRIEDSTLNRVGGTLDSQRNVISANGGAGIRILGTSTENRILNNIVGLTSDGRAARGNSLEGVAISSAHNVVGPGNILSANLRGVLLIGVGATGNTIRDNRIGTDIDGIGDLGNAREGVRIDQAPGNVVSGNGSGSQVISGNDVGVLLIGAGASGNRVSGNFIGSDVSGLRDRANSLEGVRIEGAPRNTIGGTTTPARNLISANHWGVVITGAAAVENLLIGNLIGTDITGEAPLGNEVDGVVLTNLASRNRTGGQESGAGNTIAFNVRDGVRVEGSSIRNAILTNRIFDNGELGIHLVPGGGPGPGPNELQTAPVLSAIATSVAFTNIQGTLDSRPNGSFLVQFFASPTLDPSGFGEGRQFLGETTVQTGADGRVRFSADVPATVPAGYFVTATATDAIGNTSEFSRGLAEVLGTVQFNVSAYSVDESAGQATITVTRRGGSGGLFTVNYATAGGTARAGVDYTPVSGTLTFNLGIDSQTFTVPILDDGLPEADETVFLILSNPVGAATLGSPSTAVLTIRDDDQPGAFRFSAATYTIEETAGSATITVVRDSGGAAVTVAYATADGSARAGQNYTPVSGTLSFGPGQTSQTFTIPILFDPAQTDDLTVLMTLMDPTGGATLGEPASAVLVIRDDRADRDGPRVTGLVATPGLANTARVRITFNEPLDPTTAQNLINYGFSLRTAGRDGRLGTADDRLIGLRAAVYDPATLTVTLIPSEAIHREVTLLVVINQVTDVPGAGVGVSDLSGNLLDGNDDGSPGGVFASAVVARQAPRGRTPAPAGPGGLWGRTPRAMPTFANRPIRLAPIRR